MEVNDFKMTDAGLVPNDWLTKPLGEVFNFSGGFTASRDQLSEKGYCYLHYGDIHTSRKSYLDIEKDRVNIPCIDISLSKVSSKSLLKDGDIVFVDASEDDEGTSKHLFIVNPKNLPYISGLHTIVAKPKNDSIDYLFRRFCFRSNHIKTQFRFYAVGTKVSGISKKNIAKIHVAYPPTKAEQQAIAEALGDMDATIEALEQLITKKRYIKQGTMQELLTGKRRLPGFSGAWANTSLGKIANFYKGKGLSKDQIDAFGKKPCVHYGELFTKYAESIHQVTNFTNVNGTFFLSEDNDVLMPTSDVTPKGLAKASCIKKKGVVLGGDILVIRPNRTELDGIFLSYYIRAFPEKVLQLVTGTTVFHLYAKDMGRYDFSKPDLEEQKAIVSILEEMSEELIVLESKLTKARYLKQGMMQQLLTGRIRLI